MAARRRPTPRCQNFHLGEFNHIKPCRKASVTDRSNGTPFGHTRLCAACAAEWDASRAAAPAGVAKGGR